MGTVLEKKMLVIDIMLNGMFVCQIQMPHCPLFPVDQAEVRRYVVEKKPSLTGKPFTVEYSNAKPLFKNDTKVY